MFGKKHKGPIDIVQSMRFNSLAAIAGEQRRRVPEEDEGPHLEEAG